MQDFLILTLVLVGFALFSFLICRPTSGRRLPPIRTNRSRSTAVSEVGPKLTASASRSEVAHRKLDEIEAEMRKIGFWDEKLDVLEIRNRAIEHAQMQGVSPVGSMNFELLLQAVFIPNAREAALNDSLPRVSEVGVMAMREYDYHSHVPEAERLLQLLAEFDGIITR